MPLYLVKEGHVDEAVVENQGLPCTEQLGEQRSNVDSLVIGPSLTDKEKTVSNRWLMTDTCSGIGSSAHLVVTLAVWDSRGILLVEVEAVLHQELHRLRLDDVFLRTQQGEVIHLHQVCVSSLRRRQRSQR